MTTASRLAAVAPFIAAAISLGQPCTDQWLPGPGLPGVDPEPAAIIVFDFDGPGPRNPELVVGGYYLEVAGSVQVHGIAVWNGASWRPFGGNETWAAAFTTWDPDGSGPEPVRLVARGSFGGVAGVAYWDGDTWQHIGTSSELPLIVRAFSVFDPDGPGLAQPRLIAAGWSGSTSPSRNIVQWDGSHWVVMGGLFASLDTPEINALTVFDPDGAGPAPAELIAGGNFASAAGVAAGGIAAWNGATWRPLNPATGPATSAYVYGLTTWDPDGAGPSPARLISAGGIATPSGGFWPVASWDGSSWGAVGGPFSQYASVRAATTYDQDGTGSANELLVVCGNFSSAGGVPAANVASWNGSAWSALGAGTQVFVGNSPAMLASYDRDGTGPQPPQLISAGEFTQAGPVGAVNIASWNGSDWSSLGPGFNKWIDALSLYDPDGSGPAPAELYGGGPFIQTPDGPARGVARWDGVHWHALNSALSAAFEVRVTAFALWDPDGAGPSPELLIVAGSFTSAGGLSANGIVAWDGAAWSSVGDPAVAVRAVTSWDPDGPGPITPRLIAAGFSPQGGRVKQWDGSTWQQLGGPFTVEANGDLAMAALATYDADGPGPATPDLFLGGSFDFINGLPARVLVRWDGAAWLPVDSNAYGYCTALRTFDLDGARPLPESLAAIGAITLNGAAAILHVRTGTTWESFAAPGLFTARSISPFDPDGPGPRPTRLVIGGSGYLTPTGYYPNLLWWDDAGFQPFSSGLDGPYPGPVVTALAVWQPAAGGPPRLAVAGSINRAGNYVSNSFAIWTCAQTSACYANCDASVRPPILNVDDFICFMNRFAAGDPYANCDASSNPPSLNVQDFICFADRFSAGCP